MKYSIQVIVILLLLISTPSKGQSFQGKIQYTSKSKVHVLIDTEKFSKISQEKFKAGYDASSIKKYVLNFNKNSSLFTEVIDPNINPSLGMRSNPKGPALMINHPGNYYKNLKTKNYINQKDFFGKQFIIRDKLTSINWQKTKEVKMIGKYTCFKATAKILNESNTTNVVAWYSIDIPVSQGPGKYWGLPGLILEIQTEDVIYTCTKIEFNQANDIVIKIPKKGKKITQNKFDKLFVSTLNDIRERHAN
jgi:GLPGLI family protein